MIARIWWLLGVLVIGGVLFSAPVYGGALDDDLAQVWETREMPAWVGTPVQSAARRFELALNLGIIPNDDDDNYFPISLDVHYRFTEMWGLMMRGSILLLHTDTTLADFMGEHSTSGEWERLSESQYGDISWMATFHPVYGKSTVATQNLVRFDWGVFAGFGVAFSESINERRTERAFGAHVEGVFGTDFHIYFLDWLALRLEASMRFYHAPTQWVLPCTLSVGVSFFLPKL